MQHINDLEILRQNISIVGYGQKDPAVVYKLKAFDMFSKMSDEIKNDAVYTLFSSRLKGQWHQSVTTRRKLKGPDENSGSFFFRKKMLYC